jgi:very-short-patch-repair endonuclease
MSKNKFFNDTGETRLAYYNKQYHEKKKSWKEIADMLNTYPNRVRRDAKKLGVVSRSKSDAQKTALSEGRREHPTKGKKLSDETKLKISESQGKVWDSLTDAAGVQEAARSGSKVEKYLSDFLIEKGYRVDRHKEHFLKNEKFHIDLYVRDCITAIEIDGPSHFEPVFGEDRLQRRQAADSQKNGLVLSSGMALIRVKLLKRDSQRQFRKVAISVLEVLESIKNKFPAENERYFEI